MLKKAERLEEESRNLYELPLLPTFSSLQGEWSVSIDGVGQLHSDLGILMDLMGRAGIGNLRPGVCPCSRHQDVDIVKLGPALTGRM